VGIYYYERERSRKMEEENVGIMCYDGRKVTIERGRKEVYGFKAVWLKE